MQKKELKGSRIAISILGGLLLCISACSGNKQNKAKGDGLDGTISISGAFALYPITIKWADEFKKLHPDVKFNISAGGAGKGIADALAGMVDIGLASREIHPEEIKKGAYTVFVTKDAVIPTYNPANPLAAAILKRGLKKDEFDDIFKGKIKDWQQISGLGKSFPLHAYTRSDAAGAAETWANYFNKSQEDLKGIGVFGDPGLAQAVKKDPSAIGYNNIAYLYDLSTRKQVNGIRVLPVDVNGNGQIDPEEDFYETVDNLTTAIAEGKYPSPPARKLGFLFKGKPVKKELIEFVKYVLEVGQKDVVNNGYIPLSEENIKEELKKLQ